MNGKKLDAAMDDVSVLDGCTLDELAEARIVYCIRNSLPVMSAVELLEDYSVLPAGSERREWVEGFLSLWDARVVSIKKGAANEVTS